MADEQPNCGPARAEAFSGSIGLRVGAIFIIGVSSLFMTLFPVVTGRVPRFAIPNYFYEFAKFFGSGVIIATAFIHLLGELNASFLPPLASGELEDPFPFFDSLGICFSNPSKI